MKTLEWQQVINQLTVGCKNQPNQVFYATITFHCRIITLYHSTFSEALQIIEHITIVARFAIF